MRTQKQLNNVAEDIKAQAIEFSKKTPKRTETSCLRNGLLWLAQLRGLKQRTTKWPFLLNRSRQEQSDSRKDRCDVSEIDCGDNSCLFAKNKAGMRTNGGCSCFENAGFSRSQVRSAQQMLPEILSLRSKLAEALANEQSSAKAYAESQAREVQYRSALEGVCSAIGDRLLARGPLSIAYGGGVISEIDRALSLPAPDLVGVIKVLSEALEDIADDSEERGTVETANWVLNMTREIRERIGAT